MLSLEALLRDIRQSAARLVREKSFTFTVLFIFALCLAANVAIFAVVNSVLLKPLPFFEPDRLVVVYNSYPKAGVDRAGASVPHYLERSAQVAAFADTAAYRGGSATIGEAGSPERVFSDRVTASFFRVLGASAALGRTFTDDESTPGKANAVVLSDELWRRRFSADPGVIGRSVRIDAKSYVVVGVMPPRFRFLAEKAQLWIPLAFEAGDRKATERHSNNMEMIARLKPGSSVAQAQAQVDNLNAQALAIDPYAKLVADAGFTTVVHGLQSDFVSDLRPVLRLLQAGVLFLLLIGAINLANLMLVRATGRTKEFSVRQALGGSWPQLARSLVVETLVLTAAGGVLGLALGAAALRGIWVLAASGLPAISPPTLDFTVMGAALGASLLLGLVLAAPVVWHTLSSNPASALSSEARGGTTSRQVHRLRHALIVAQIALAFLLIAGTGLLGLSFQKILAVHPGFHAENVLTGTLSLPVAKYPEMSRQAFVTQLTAACRALPGVQSVGVITSLPFTGSHDDNAITVVGRTLEPGESLRAHFTSGISGDYFGAMGIPLREGRALTADDTAAGRNVCVVDEDLARRYWPKGGALGHELINGTPQSDSKKFAIVGVVGAVKQTDLAEAAGQGAVYFPYSGYHSSSFVVAVRTNQAPESVGAELRSAVLRLDPELPMNDLKAMTVRIGDSIASRRAPFLLAGIFAAVALILAAVGIYGVLAYSVVQRRREIGVRMALGAQPQQILRQFLGLGGRLLAIGLPLGLIGSWLGGQAMSGLLFGVAPANPLVFGGTAVLLFLMAMLACWLPSRRAARIAPTEALRA